MRSRASLAERARSKKIPHRPSRRGISRRATADLQRAQEVQQILLPLLGEVVEVRDHAVRLRALACMRLDGAYEVRRPAVVQEEDPLTHAPQRRAAEFSRTR